jgi:hypothetical protein
MDSAHAAPGAMHSTDRMADRRPVQNRIGSMNASATQPEG